MAKSSRIPDFSTGLDDPDHFVKLIKAKLAQKECILWSEEAINRLIQKDPAMGPCARAQNIAQSLLDCLQKYITMHQILYRNPVMRVPKARAKQISQAAAYGRELYSSCWESFDNAPKRFKSDEDAAGNNSRMRIEALVQLDIYEMMATNETTIPDV